MATEDAEAATEDADVAEDAAVEADEDATEGVEAAESEDATTIVKGTIVPVRLDQKSLRPKTEVTWICV